MGHLTKRFENAFFRFVKPFKLLQKKITSLAGMVGLLDSSGCSWSCWSSGCSGSCWSSGFGGCCEFDWLGGTGGPRGSCGSGYDVEPGGSCGLLMGVVGLVGLVGLIHKSQIYSQYTLTMDLPCDDITFDLLLVLILFGQLETISPFSTIKQCLYDTKVKNRWKI